MTESNDTKSITINVSNVNTANATAIAGVSMQVPSLLMRVLWFVLIGWYAGLVWISCAFLIGITIIGLPFAIAMLKYTTTAFWLGKVYL